MRNHSWTRIIVLLSIFIVSMGAGFLGGLLVSQREYPLTLEDIAVRPVILEDKTRQPTSNNVSDLIEVVRPSLMMVYSAIQEHSNGMQRPITERVYTDDMRRGYALIATADGWLIAPSSVGKNIRVQNIRVIGQDKQIYAVDKKIDDPNLPITYLKITASRLRPIRFASVLEGDIHSEVFYLKSLRHVEKLILSQLEYAPGDAIRYANRLDKRFNAMDAFPEEGLPVFNKNQEVIGMTAIKGITPLHYSKNTFFSIVRGGSVKNFPLAIAYLDNAWIFTPLTSDRKDGILHYGATIVADNRAKTAKDTGVLLPGDTIISVNDEDVNEQRSFSEILLSYKPGDKLRLKMQRKSKSKEEEQLFIIPPYDKH